MNILGLSFDYHDAAAALVVDGRLIAAGQEERFTRKKHDAALPKHSIDFCLKSMGLTAGDIDTVAFYEITGQKFDRIVKSSLRRLPRGRRYLFETFADWMRNGKFEVKQRIADSVGVDASRICAFSHHASHAGSAFFCSPFEEAVVVTLDGVGEFETATISVGRGNQLTRIKSVGLPHSIGLFYSAFTAFLGFEVNEGEYKVMGMAGFGQPRYVDAIKSLIKLHDDGRFAIDQTCFEFLCPEVLPYRPSLLDRFGPARVAESRFAIDPEPGVTEVDLITSRHYADIAASLQRVTEDAILHIVTSALKVTGMRNLCLAGGVALNSLANGRLIREIGCPLYVHPAAGDAGGAVGAAMLAHHRVAGARRSPPLTSAYLGSWATEAETVAAISASGFVNHELFPTDAALVERVATLLAEGKVLGWHQGRAEWGPRALGNRSILANPTLPDMQRRVNESIKFREPFRPFAPVVPIERANEFFDMPTVQQPTAPECFMLAVHPVKLDKRRLLPAITHRDGTARVQVVSRQSNPLYYDLLEAFGRITGIPVILNTSFNLRGEPVVDTPADALKTFALSGLDAVVIGRHVVFKGLGL